SLCMSLSEHRAGRVPPDCQMRCTWAGDQAADKDSSFLLQERLLTRGLLVLQLGILLYSYVLMWLSCSYGINKSCGFDTFKGCFSQLFCVSGGMFVRPIGPLKGY